MFKPSVTTETLATDGLIIGHDGIRHRKVTMLTGNGPYPRGTVLGKITASGKYIRSASAASDGSQTPDVILADDVPALTADRDVLVYIAGEFNAAEVTLGAGHSIASIRDGLRSKGIFLR